MQDAPLKDSQLGVDIATAALGRGWIAELTRQCPHPVRDCHVAGIDTREKDGCGGNHHDRRNGRGNDAERIIGQSVELYKPILAIERLDPACSEGKCFRMET